MIARIKAWFRFDAETLAATANAMAAFSGVPLLVPYVNDYEQQPEGTETSGHTACCARPSRTGVTSEAGGETGL